MNTNQSRISGSRSEYGAMGVKPRRRYSPCASTCFGAILGPWNDKGRTDRPAPIGQDFAIQSIRSSLNVRWPEIIVDTIDWRDMMSSRIAA